MLWVLESEKNGRNVWWCEEKGAFTDDFGDATVYAAQNQDELSWTPHTWVALDINAFEDWV
jgi:hypothetical protein